MDDLNNGGTKRYLLYDGNTKEGAIIIFATNQFSQLLNNNHGGPQKILANGTFKMNPPFFEQVYPIPRYTQLYSIRLLDIHLSQILLSPAIIDMATVWKSLVHVVLSSSVALTACSSQAIGLLYR